MKLNILQAIDDPKLFKPWFKDNEMWQSWRAFLCALFGLLMDAEQRTLYQRCTKRSQAPTNAITEAWLVVGRRGGKSFISALVAVFLACFVDYSKYLSPGERGTVMLIAQDRRQARVLMRYISALLNNVPLLKPLIANETKESIELTNKINIEIHTCSFRTVRGYTIVACLCDEIAFWRSEDSANPDFEILDAVRPGMATIPNALLLCLSSPYAKKGALYDAYKHYYGKDTREILVWQADTRTMNPTVNKTVIDRAYKRDPESAKAEYGAEFRSDIESYVLREAVEACTVLDRFELPRVPGVSYRAFCDPSGGSKDSMTLAICHEEDKRKILDCVREVKPPFNPDNVCKDFADLLKSYRLNIVTGDRYAGVWPESKFREYGITYKTAERTKSDLYKDFLPLINSGQVELLDNKKLFNQIINLERRTTRGGRDSIDHPAGAHDDLANAVAGVAVHGTKVKRAGVWGREKSRNPFPGMVTPGSIRTSRNIS